MVISTILPAFQFARTVVLELVETATNCTTHTTTYAMSREILETLGEKVLFDSHCHMDFIFFWKSQGKKFESFDQFVQAYPLMEHSSLEGFIT